MPTATKIAGKCNEICHAALSTVTGVTAYKGRLRMLDATDFEEQVRALNKENQCFAITWVYEENRKPIQSGTGTLELNILLFFRLDQFTTSDCNLNYDKVDEIGEALTPDTVWSSVGAKMQRINIRRVENGLQDNVMQWKITVLLDAPYC
jgi:hypothetical protein